ncbi:prothrombin-like [Stylophora pistillata]|uniref:prothrombin-like n=1 Tax=Stylophora pistillata TaxID=50429 RepID=UPI000C03DECF|nr:prothrombin-like [Stylophora pistillata]
MIRYTCFPQYEIRGPVTRTCLADGKWSGKAPKCLTPPRFWQVPSNETIKETKSATLLCSASTSDTKITWYKDDKVVHKSTFAVLSSGNLLIVFVTHEDEGWYVCNATNEAGTKLARAYLTVLRALDSDCGKPTLTRRGRIVGGTKVEAGHNPWQVSLWNKKANKHFCGGSLVSERWIVTAAHCLTLGGKSLLPSDIEVRLGKLYSKKAEPSREQIISPDRIVFHHHYDSGRADYDADIALIHLKTDVIFTDYVRPIYLPLPSIDDDSELLKTGNIGVITGWGRKRETGREVLRRMHQVKVPIVDQVLCQAAHKKHTVTSNMFCAGYYNGTLGDACAGDSGGPLAIDNGQSASDDDQRWVLAGVISWGDGCGRIGKYSVYTRVSKFVHWIDFHVSMG